MINKETIRGVLFGAGLGVLVVASYAWADSPPPTSLRPNGGLATDAKTMLGAQRLFRVEDCEVWGFNWRGQDRVVAVCPHQNVK
jgi:hypothetical protein